MKILMHLHNNPPQYPDEGCQHHPVGAGSVVRCLINKQVRSLHCFPKNITSHTAVQTSVILVNISQSVGVGVARVCTCTEDLKTTWDKILIINIKMFVTNHYSHVCTILYRTLCRSYPQYTETRKKMLLYLSQDFTKYLRNGHF